MAWRSERPRRCSGRRGFTFIEVLFAVLILGIGFIMVAGVFPVAIGQVQANCDETVAAAVGRGAVARLSQMMTDANTPPTGGAVRPIETAPELWSAVAGEAISTADPRFAWVAGYRRDEGAMYVQVVVVVVKARNRSAYDPRLDLPRYAADVTDTPPTLAFRSLKARFEYAGGPGTVAPARPDDPAAAALTPGAILVVATPGPGGDGAGRVYRVGSNRPGQAGGWDLSPGTGLGSPDEEPDGPVGVLVVGRGYADPADPGRGYDGPAQDVAVYSSFVALR